MSTKTKRKGSRQAKPATDSKRVQMAPVSVSRTITARAPKLLSVGGQTIISHREPVQSLTGTGAFYAAAVNCNPRDSLVFPWLSSKSVGWEMFRFRRLKLEYVPRCSSTTAGLVILAIDYDPSDGLPASAADLQSYQGAVSGNAWSALSTIAQPTLMDRLRPWRRLTSDPGLYLDSQLPDYVPCRLVIASDGAPAGVIGQIFVDYEVEFAVPELPGFPAASRTAPGLQKLGAAGATVTNGGSWEMTALSVYQHGFDDTNTTLVKPNVAGTVLVNWSASISGGTYVDASTWDVVLRQVGSVSDLARASFRFGAASTVNGPSLSAIVGISHDAGLFVQFFQTSGSATNIPVVDQSHITVTCLY